MHIGKEEVINLNAGDGLILMNYLFLWKIKKFIEAYEPGCLDVHLLTQTNFPWSKPFVMVEATLGPNVDHVRKVKRKINVKPSADCVWEFSYTFANKAEDPIEKIWIRKHIQEIAKLESQATTAGKKSIRIGKDMLAGMTDEEIEKVKDEIAEVFNFQFIVVTDDGIVCALFQDDDNMPV